MFDMGASCRFIGSGSGKLRAGKAEVGFDYWRMQWPPDGGAQLPATPQSVPEAHRRGAQ